MSSSGHGTLQLSNLANNAHSISQIHATRLTRLMSNESNIDRITRITTPQITKSDFEDNFLNGTNFDDSNGFEALTLPIGCSVSSLFN